MYIGIYIAVIFSFCGISLLLFFFFRNRQKEKLDAFNKTGKLQPKAKKSSQPKAQERVEPVKIEKDENMVTDEELARTEPVVDAQFEDFELESVEEKSQPNGQEFDDPGEVNLGQRRASSLEDKFAEYEKFLQRHMGRTKQDDAIFDDLGQSEDFSFGTEQEPEDELDALANFDFEMLKGKSEEEIELIISSLPEKAQEILRNDILGKHDVD